MMHVLYRAHLMPKTAFGTPLAGDTLFGQLCWTLREAQGEEELRRRLEGYRDGQPWLVVSDGFPTGYLPKPALPPSLEGPIDPEKRKAAKKRRWVAAASTEQALAALLTTAADDAQAYGENPTPVSAQQAHNTLNRLTGSTGKGEFAPYAIPLIFHPPEQVLDLYLVADSSQTNATEIAGLLEALGACGYGRDASTGLGKFDVLALDTFEFASPEGANSWWTLAPCAPQGQGFDGSRSFWRPLTRFGRHGNIHATGGKPFKTPVLLAATGAVLSASMPVTPRLFVGQGLGGDGSLSKAEPATVHQGYAPVVPLALPL